jgi:hypothetical protein
VRGGVDEVGIITGELNRSFCWGVVPREREDTMGNVSWVHGGGPLARLAEGYGVELARLGFTRNSVVTHVVLMGQLSRWMSEVEIDVGELTEGRVEGSSMLGAPVGSGGCRRRGRWPRCLAI